MFVIWGRVLRELLAKTEVLERENRELAQESIFLRERLEAETEERKGVYNLLMRRFGLIGNEIREEAPRKPLGTAVKSWARIKHQLELGKGVTQPVTRKELEEVMKEEEKNAS